MKEKKSEEINLTVNDLARRWKVSESHLYNSISNKTLKVKPFRIGRLVRFRLADIEEFERK